MVCYKISRCYMGTIPLRTWKKCIVYRKEMIYQYVSHSHLPTVVLVVISVVSVSVLFSVPICRECASSPMLPHAE